MVLMVGDFDLFSRYETRITGRAGIAGTSLAVLLAEIDEGHF